LYTHSFAQPALPGYGTLRRDGSSVEGTSPEILSLRAGIFRRSYSQHQNFLINRFYLVSITAFLTKPYGL